MRFMESDMRTTQKISIPMPTKMAREWAIECWLHEQVGPAYDALKADSSRAVGADKVRARIAKEHKATTGKTK